MAVEEKCKRRIFLICADEAAAFVGDLVGKLSGNDFSGNHGEINLSEEMPECRVLSAVISAPEERCREYAKHVSGGKVNVYVSDGICELTDEEKKSSYTPRRIISSYREVLSSYDGDVVVVASAGYIKALICFLECRDYEKLDEIDVLPGFIYEVTIPGRLCAVITAEDERVNDLYRPMPSDVAPTLMEYALDTLTRAGVAETVIVCGQNKEKLEKAFAGFGRTFVDSESFRGLNGFDFVEHDSDGQEKTTGISSSDGFSHLLMERSLDDSKCDGVFLFPSSVPVFTLFSVQQLMRSMGFDVPYGNAVKMCSDTMECKKHAVAVPTYKGKRGYPVLVRYEYFQNEIKEIQNSTISDIVALLAKADDVMEVSVPDPAVVLSTGTKSGCEKAKDHLFSLRTPGLAYCRELLQWMNLPKYKLRHSEKVAFYAREMAEEFNSRGRDTYSLLLDENITAAGGMLHDIAKGYPRHAACGAAILRSLNMARVAEIVENHQNLAERYFHSTSPVLIVYLADKMFCGDECVGIEERFRRKKEKHKGDEKALKMLAYKEKQALRAKEVYENSILGWPVG